ncbi:MAG: alpha/beta hydrolase [Planctomycetota bacterium]
MSRLRRRLLFLGVLILLIGLVAGYLFQSTTQQALRRAEAFRFRRLVVSKQSESGAFRFFFATNRAVENPDGPLDERFGRSRGDALSFGRFDTKIEPTLGVGMLIDPTDWFQNEEIKMLEKRLLERAEIIQELRAQVERSPHRGLMININGFREQFGSALRKTAFVGHILDINAPLLVFDWPGDQGSSLQGYRRAQGIAQESGADLAATIEMVIREVRPQRLWMMANSMGGEVVVHAFNELYEKPDLADKETEIEDVILTAPDVCHERFGREFRDVIGGLARHVTVYVSSNDRALLMSRVLNRGRRLGESTIRPGNPDQAWSAARAFELVEPDSDVVTLVDVTPVNRTRNFHNFSLETPEFFDDIFLRIVNQATPRSRLQYRVDTEDGRRYWVLTGGQ